MRKILRAVLVFSGLAPLFCAGLDASVWFWTGRANFLGIEWDVGRSIYAVGSAAVALALVMLSFIEEHSNYDKRHKKHHGG